MEESVLFLQVKSRESVYFEGNVYAVTAYNHRGVFDVLGAHINFITLITNKLIIHLSPVQQKEIQLQKGVMKVVSNSVEVYIV